MKRPQHSFLLFLYCNAFSIVDKIAWITSTEFQVGLNVWLIRCSLTQGDVIFSGFFAWINNFAEGFVKVESVESFEISSFSHSFHISSWCNLSTITKHIAITFCSLSDCHVAGLTGTSPFLF